MRHVSRNKRDILSRPAKAGRLFMPFAILLLAASLLPCQPCLAKSKSKSGKATKKDTIKITSKSASYSMDEETFSIPGDVSIETSEIKVSGRGLTFNNKTREGSIGGNPVRLSYGNNTTATAGAIKFNLTAKTAQASGGVTMNHSTGTLTVAITAGALNLDMGKKQHADASGGIVITTGDTAAEKASDEKKKIAAQCASGNPPPGCPEKASGIPVFATSPATFTANYAEYNMDSGEITSGDNLRIETPDAVFTTQKTKVSLTARTIEAESGFDLKATGDIAASSDYAHVDYGAKKAVLKGNVRATRGDESFSAGTMEIDYNEGQRTIICSGGVDISLMIEVEEPEETPAGGE